MVSAKKQYNIQSSKITLGIPVADPESPRSPVHKATNSNK